MVNGSPLLVSSFVALALLIAAAFVAAVFFSTPPDRSTHRVRDTVIASIATTAWLVVTFWLAASGRLSFSSTPPTAVLLLAATLALGFGIGMSRLGARLAAGLPLAALVGAQAFRFPLELLLHRSYTEGLMPVQMSFAGLNYDIISGLSAIVVALVLVRKPGSITLVRVWNVAGILLLANILTVALLSTPTPIRVFHNEPANDWIARAPWVWLPTVYVLAAIIGHILVYRRLRLEVRARTRAAGRRATNALSLSPR